MSDRPAAGAARVAVVGGGLAGLAATVALAEQGLEVELFEARRRLGGRATSYRDPGSGELVDHCQHVSMGCCTNLADFCRRVGIAELFRHAPRLHFFSPEGERFDLEANSWFPAPAHLAPALAALGYLSTNERRRIAQAMWRMMREPEVERRETLTIGQWLREQRQSQRAIDRFWSVVLVSALSESVDRAAYSYARKVFVEGFMTNRRGYVMEVPDAALDELYGSRLEAWLSHHRVRLRSSAPVAQVAATAQGAMLTTRDREQQAFDYVVLALPWHAIGDVIDSALSGQLPELAGLAQLEGVPITGVHLWFDAEITPLPHAVLVEGLCQWLFRRPASERGGAEHYYQVVISASRDLANRSREEILAQIQAELRQVFPAAGQAQLLRAKIVTEHNAVFSPRPGIDRFRPRQQSSVRSLVYAGDWTATGWPATMEGAVRSGYLAAEAILANCGQQVQLLAPELPPAALSRLLIR